MKRRTFIKGAVAAAVAAALPLGGRAYRSHEFSPDSDMCLVCRMTRQMIVETGPPAIECPGTALYDYKTFKVAYPPGTRYAAALARSMMQTREAVTANVFGRVFSP